MQVNGITWHASVMDDDDQFAAMRELVASTFGVAPLMDMPGVAVFALPDGALYELYAKGTQPPFGYNDGGVAFGFRVDDIEAASAAVEAPGGELLSDVNRAELGEVEGVPGCPRRGPRPGSGTAAPQAAPQPKESPMPRRTTVLAIATTLVAATGGTAVAAGELITRGDQIAPDVVDGRHIASGGIARTDQQHATLRLRVRIGGGLFGDPGDGTVARSETGVYRIAFNRAVLTDDVAAPRDPRWLDECAVVATPRVGAVSPTGSGHEITLSTVRSPTPGTVTVVAARPDYAAGRTVLVDAPFDVAAMC
jgi:predicted enzyme related to lactoylglutathione lyase